MFSVPLSGVSGSIACMNEEKKERQCLIVVGEPVQSGIKDAYRRCVLETAPTIPPLLVLYDEAVYDITGSYPYQDQFRRFELIEKMVPHATIHYANLTVLGAFTKKGNTAFCIYGGESKKMRQAIGSVLKKEFPDTTIRFTKNI